MFSIFKKKLEPQPLFFKTDIHCHVLPGIDDGAPDAATGADLVQEMQKWGIDRIIASPHITYGTFDNNAATTDAAMAELQAELDRRGCTVQLSHSAENRIDDLFIKNYEQGTLITLPGNRVLVENSFFQEPWNLDQLLFDLQVKGFRPILVHPERYSYYYGKKDRYATIHNGGTAFQINILSLAGHYGRDEKRFAEYLIEQGLVDYVGTDLHRASHVESINRYLASKDYLRHRDALAGRIGNDTI